MLVLWLITIDRKNYWFVQRGDKTSGIIVHG